MAAFRTASHDAMPAQPHTSYPPRHLRRAVPLLACILLAVVSGLGVADAGARPAAVTHVAVHHGKGRQRCRGVRARHAHARRRCPKRDNANRRRRVLALRAPAPTRTPTHPAKPSTPQAGQPSSGQAGATPSAPEPFEPLTNPIDPRYLTDVPFGTRSFWLQPWRAYLDTWPASRLREALGINFNVEDREAQATAQLLQDSGFELARIEINWSALSYEHPSEFTDEAHVRTRLEALHDHGLRPLILLDANSEAPAPAKRITLETTAAAPAGATTVTLSPASAAAVVPGKSGFDQLSFGGDPDILITAIGAGGVATLSKPLPSALPVGAHKGATLLYAPFQHPMLADGQPNPAFRETLAGWLAYVQTVSREATDIFGPGGYDLEVWNELSFGSQFLNAESYFTPVVEGEESETTKEITKAILNETVAYVRNPTNGISPAVGVSDGFASQTPFPSGANAPLGLTALSKHLYQGAKEFPTEYPEGAITPVDALGQADTVSHGSFTPLFVPGYQSLFPEYYLSATSTETVVRDLAPFTTYVYGFPHGREVGPQGGTPVQKWMTEYNLGTSGASVIGPDEQTPLPVTLTTADKEHLQAKALLRSLVAMVSKGMAREYFYGAAPGNLSLINKNFFSDLQANPGAYPGDQAGGETMSAFHNLFTQFQGPGSDGAPRQLQLQSVAQEGNHAQFGGDGTPAHPDLYDREVLAVLPFQTSPTQLRDPGLRDDPRPPHSL